MGVSMHDSPSGGTVQWSVGLPIDVLIKFIQNASVNRRVATCLLSQFEEFDVT